MAEREYYGYIPPKSFVFTKLRDLQVAYIAAACSLECARFIQYVETHTAANDTYQARFLPAYSLADWATGKIDPAVYEGRERTARESLMRWANAVIELNTIFHAHDVVNPIVFLEKKGYIVRSKTHYGWEAVKDAIELGLGLRIGGKNGA